MVGGQRSICSAILRLGRFMQPAPSNLPVMVRLLPHGSFCQIRAIHQQDFANHLDERRAAAVKEIRQLTS